MAKTPPKGRYERIFLDGGFSFGKPFAHPQNWESKNASTRKDWYIHYRFYDPTIPEGGKYFTGKQCIVRGMNDFRDLAGRQSMTREIPAKIYHMLQVEGFSPIDKTRLAPDEDPLRPQGCELNEKVFFVEALNIAYSKLTCQQNTKDEVRSILNFVIPAIQQVRMAGKPIGEVRKRDIMQVMERCKKNKGDRWSAHMHNKYRSYLMMLLT